MSENNYNNIKITENSLLIHNVDRCMSDEGEDFGPGIKEFFMLIYIISGKGTFISGGKKYFLEKGDSFLIYPDTVVEFASDNDEPWEYYSVAFSGNSVREFLEYTDFTENSPVLTFNFDSKLEIILKKMYELPTANVFYNIDITGLMYSLFSVLMGFSVFSKRIDNDRNFLLAKAMDYIHRNYSEKITAEKVAGYIGLSQEEFNTLFEENNKCSFDDYLEKYRMDKACDMIRKGFSTAILASSVGYNDNLTFAKIFRNINGVSPSHYLKKKKFLTALGK